MDARRDEELLADHLAGRAGAFDRLVTRYTNELFGFLVKFVGNAAVAEDLVQETFLQVHLASATFDGTRKFKPWLYTIAANKARDHLRAKSRRQEQTLDGPDDGQGGAADRIDAESPSSAEAFDADERKQNVRNTISRMPDHLRLILTLGYYQQLPYAEIAEILDIPVGTVKSRLHAAVSHFAKLWRREMTTAIDGMGNGGEER